MTKGGVQQREGERAGSPHPPRGHQDLCGEQLAPRRQPQPRVHRRLAGLPVVPQPRHGGLALLRRLAQPLRPAAAGADARHAGGRREGGRGEALVPGPPEAARLPHHCRAEAGRLPLVGGFERCGRVTIFHLNAHRQDSGLFYIPLVSFHPVSLPFFCPTFSAFL